MRTKRVSKAGPVHRSSILYKACSLSLLSLLNKYNIRNGHIRFLTDRLLQILLFWLCGIGAYNPSIKIKTQQNSLILILMNTKSIPSALTEPINHIRKQLSQIHLAQTLNRYEQHLRHQRNKKEKEESRVEEKDDESPSDDFFCLPEDDGESYEITDKSEEKDVIKEVLVQNILQTTKICLICNFFSYEHPSELCQWSTTSKGRRRPCKNVPYNIPETPFVFCLDDMEKINSEDPEITKKFNKEDKSQSDYSQSSTSTISTDSSMLSYISSSGKKKFKRRPAFADYVSRFGILYAEEWQAYNLWRRNALSKEKIGTVRPLLPEEIRYFDFAQKFYKEIPPTRKKKHNFSNPPLPWQKRKNAFTAPTEALFISQMDALFQFATVDCRESAQSERNRWEDVLGPFEIGSLDRVLWAVAFLKSTNGVADKVSCGHFRKLITKCPTLSLEIHKDPYALASLIRQTSKWVKNTFVLINIFKHIKYEWSGVPSQDFHDWLNFYEIGPKTASLLLHSAFNKAAALPVDSHVWFAFRKWGWTNAKTPDECSWQASLWIPPAYYIKTNDVIGSIRQALADKEKKFAVMRKAKKISPEIYALVALLQ